MLGAPEVESVSSAPFRVEDLTVDPATGVVTGPGGSARLEPRVMAVLQVLAQNSGQLVARRDLLQQIWPGGETYDEALTQSVYQLRQQLAAAGGGNHRELVSTVPKRGYLLKGEVSPLHPAPAESPPPDASARRRPIAFLVLGIASLIAVVALAVVRFGERPASVPAPAPVATASLPATIAVLPFRNLTEQPDNDFLVDGLSEELLGTLSLNPQLRVTSRNSAFQFKGEERDARDIGRQLGVHYVLDGGVSNAGERVMIQARLYDTGTGATLWDEAYNRSLADWLEVQQSVAAEVARALDIVLRQGSGGSARDGGTTNIEAHLEVLRARQLLATRGVADAEQAVEHLQRALMLDPNYALAYARLADAILIKAAATGGVEPVRPVVAPLLDKALQLDPGFGEAYALRSLLTDDAAEAERDLRRGLELNPSYARGYELLSRRLGATSERSVEAMANIDSAIALDPLSPGNFHAKASILMMQGRWEEAADLDRRALDLNPQYHDALVQLAQMTAIQGDFADSVDYSRRALELDPRAFSVREALITLYLALGDIERARAANDPPTPFGNMAIGWTVGGDEGMANMLYHAPAQVVQKIEPLVVSQVALSQALADGEFPRALAMLSTVLPYADGVPVEANGWGLYAYANAVQLIAASGDETTALKLQQQVEERMAYFESRFPRQAFINSATRAVLYARQGRVKDACAALEFTYLPKPRPYWRVVFGNPALTSIESAPCMRSIRERIDLYVQSQRARMEANEAKARKAQPPVADPPRVAGAER